jgi:hypothetical protein
MSVIRVSESLIIDKYFNFLSILFKRNLSTRSVSKHKTNKLPKSLDKSLSCAQTQVKYQVNFDQVPLGLCQYARLLLSLISRLNFTLNFWSKQIILLMVLSSLLMVNDVSFGYYDVTCWLHLLGNMTPLISLLSIACLTSTLKTSPIVMKRYRIRGHPC